jgi:tape measure domain-containing protein
MPAGTQVGSLFVQVGVAGFAEVGRVFDSVENRMKATADRLQSIGGRLSAAVTVPLVGLGIASVQSAGQMQAMTRSLEAIMGSAEGAEAEIERLRQAATKPGLGFEQAVRASVQLQSVGRSADQARASIEAIANAVALSGGTADDFGEVVRQFTQIQSLGRLTAENLNVILERSPSVARALQSAFGTASAEAIRESGVSIEDFFTKLQAGLESLPRAQGGILNDLANGFDNLKVALKPLGEAISAVIVPAFTRLSDMALRAGEAFGNLPEGTQRVIVVVGLLAAALGPALLAIGGLITLLPVLAAGFAFLTGPVGITIAGLAAIAVAAVKAYRESEGFREAVDRLWTSTQQLLGSLGGLIDALTLFDDKVGDAAESTHDFSLSAALLTRAADSIAFIFRTGARLADGFTGAVNRARAAVEVLLAGDFFRRGAFEAALGRLQGFGKGGGLDKTVVPPPDPPNPFTSTSSGASDAANKVRSLADVMADLRRSIAEAGLSLKVNLIDRTAFLQEKASALRTALSQAFNLEGSLRPAAAILQQMAEAAAAAARDAFVASSGKLQGITGRVGTDDLLEGVSVVQRLRELGADIPARLKLSTAALDEMIGSLRGVSFWSVDAVNNMSAFAIRGLETLREAGRQMTAILTDDIGRAFGDLAGSLTDLRDNFEGVSDLSEAFKQFGSAVVGIIPSMIAAITSLITKMVALFAVTQLLKALGVDPALISFVTGGFSDLFGGGRGGKAGIKPFTPAPITAPVIPAGLAAGGGLSVGALRGETRLSGGVLVTAWEAEVAERRMNGYGPPRWGGS